MLIRCNSCKRKISADVKHCPKCGGKNVSPIAKFLGIVLIITMLMDYISKMF